MFMLQKYVFIPTSWTIFLKNCIRFLKKTNLITPLGKENPQIISEFQKNSVSLPR